MGFLVLTQNLRAPDRVSNDLIPIARLNSIRCPFLLWIEYLY